MASENLRDSDVRSVYVAGPMRGYPDNNQQAFRDAAAALREQGYEVVCPIELDDEVGFDHTVADLDEATYDRFLAKDIIEILSRKPDALVMLEGWEQSKGAALEVHVCRELNIPVFSYPDGDLIKRPTDYHPPSDENILEEANRVLGDEKAALYGHPYDDFSRTALIATAVLGQKLRPGCVVEPEDIPLLMIGAKISRQVNRPTRRGWRNIAGYARTGEQVWEEIDRLIAAGELSREPREHS